MKKNLKIAVCYMLHALLIITWVIFIITKNILNNAAFTMIFATANLIFCLIEIKTVNQKRDNS